MAKSDFEIYISNADGYTAQICALKEQIASLEASRRANLAMAWTCPEALDEDGEIKTMITSAGGNDYVRSVRPAHDLDVIVQDKTAVEHIAVMADKAAAKAKESYKPKETDLQALFKLLPNGYELEEASRLDPQIVYSTRA